MNFDKQNEIRIKEMIIILVISFNNEPNNAWVDKCCSEDFSARIMKIIIIKKLWKLEQQLNES